MSLAPVASAFAALLSFFTIPVACSFLDEGSVPQQIGIDMAHGMSSNGVIVPTLPGDYSVSSSTSMGSTMSSSEGYSMSSSSSASAQGPNRGPGQGGKIPIVSTPPGGDGMSSSSSMSSSESVQGTIGRKGKGRKFPIVPTRPRGDYGMSSTTSMESTKSASEEYTSSASSSESVQHYGSSESAQGSNGGKGKGRTSGGRGKGRNIPQQTGFGMENGMRSSEMIEPKIQEDYGMRSSGSTGFA
eukprot:TRINITY_DN103_c0_g1_i12.p1 TRINITY_DN103_c0_g1~~TRINITY_DN103_c0_g1_i12.p1  ORF type:complete len:243 (-),score=20.77 TRINITY_DN103_c0_g1_i12:130-858(-)